MSHSMNSVTRQINTPEATGALAVSLAPFLAPGCTVLLSGPIGAGKTHFARQLISTLLRQPEDIPSPTYTIVQIYDAAPCEIWHVDLYRISSPTECDELGLVDAFDTACCIVEWPDRLGALAPSDALSLTFDVRENERSCHATWSDPRWNPWGASIAG